MDVDEDEQRAGKHGKKKRVGRADVTAARDAQANASVPKRKAGASDPTREDERP